MKTILEDWYIVTVFDGEVTLGKILYGICKEDQTNRFISGNYVCTSRVEKIYPEKQLAITFNGNRYELVGEGKKAQVQVKDYELLRNGFCPEKINLFRIKH